MAWSAPDTRGVWTQLVVNALAAVSMTIFSSVLPLLNDHAWLQYVGYGVLAVVLDALRRFLSDTRR